MPKIISPDGTSRAQAFELWMSSPMPMVTLVKTLNVSRLLKVAKRMGASFNMLMCWCIGRAATQVKEFFLLPVNGQLMEYDRIAVNVIVNNLSGGINSCDIPFADSLAEFDSQYRLLTSRTAKECRSIFDDEAMVVGTSAMVETELDCIVNQYTDKFCNPMVMWGKYRRGLFKTTLPVSFQFHHVQMDGGHAARFLELLQKEIATITIR